MSFYCQVAYIPTAEMVKNVVDVSFNLVFWHGLSFYFSLLLHFAVGLTVNFSVLL